MPTLGLNRPTLEGKWRGMKKNILYKCVPTQLQPEERLFFLLGAWFLVRTWVAKKSFPIESLASRGTRRFWDPFQRSHSVRFCHLFQTSVWQAVRLPEAPGDFKVAPGQSQLFENSQAGTELSVSISTERWPCSFEDSSLCSLSCLCTFWNSSLVTPCWSSTAHSSQRCFDRNT